MVFAAFILGEVGVVRRRQRERVVGEAEVLDFIPDQWPGETDFERYEAWAAARKAWAAKSVAEGGPGLPLYMGWIPDQPWSPYGPDGTPNF